MERAITPVTVKLIDGEERKFLLSMGGVRRLKERFALKSLKEVLDLDASEGGVAILYEAMLDKCGLTESEFAEKLPAHLTVVVKAVAELFGVSFSDAKERPTEPPLTVQ